MMRRVFALVLTLCLQPGIGGEFMSRAEWQRLKNTLSGSEGIGYFEGKVRNAELPPMQGTLVSATPVDHPNEFRVAILDDSHAEVKLVMKKHLEKALPAGTPVRFEGVATAFEADPFLLTIEVETVNRAVQ